jgi:predicted DsbA family dithiol-disulfide isomerase
VKGALTDLEKDGWTFNTVFERWPFFLKGRQPDVDHWYAKMGYPPNTERGELEDAGKMGGKSDEGIDRLYRESGLSPRNKENTRRKIWTDTMQAHKLAQYAATESSEKGEIVWWMLGQNFFMGKETEIRPIRLDDSQLLLEVADKAGLDLQKAQSVLDSNAFEQEILQKVDQVHSLGIHSIPLLIFEVEQLAQGPWTSGRSSKFRKVHHGSGNMQAFRSILEELHHASLK